jgi:hypothetical protein
MSRKHYIDFWVCVDQIEPPAYIEVDVFDKEEGVGFAFTIMHEGKIRFGKPHNLDDHFRQVTHWRDRPKPPTKADNAIKFKIK